MKQLEFEFNFKPEVEEPVRKEKSVNIQVYSRLQDSLDGKVTDWFYTGVHVDYGQRSGRCACGCKIRYAHIIKNIYTNKEEVVGIVCIESVPEFAHIVEQIRQDEINKELAVLSELEAEYKTYKETISKRVDEYIRITLTVYLPLDLYNAHKKGCEYQNLKTTKAKIKKLTNYLKKEKSKWVKAK